MITDGQHPAKLGVNPQQNKKTKIRKEKTMKNNKLVKISLLVLSLALVIGAAFAMSVSADTTPTKPVIVSQNVAYQGDFALMYAVDAEGITGSVTLNVYDKYPSEDSISPICTVVDETAEFVAGNLNKTVYEFKTKGIAAADICTQYYIQAVVNDTNAKSDVLRYSLAEYLYERLATVPVEENGVMNPSDDQKELYNNVIAFGDSAQKVIGGISDSANRVKNYRFVTVDGGKLDTYFTTGVYPIGTALNLTPTDPEASGVVDWSVTHYNDGVAGDPQPNMTNVVVEDNDRTHVKFGTVVEINYPAGYQDFEAVVKFDAPINNYFGTFTSSYPKDNAKFIKLEDEHGVVLEVKDLAANLDMYRNNSVNNNEVDGLTATTGTASEISFDIKLNTSGDANDYVDLRLVNGANYNVVYLIRLYQYGENGELRNKLYVENGKDSSESKEYNINPNDWFNVRMVLYANDADFKLHIYINGATDPLIFDATDSGGFTMHTVSIFRIAPNGTTGPDGCYIDNFHHGFIKEN